MTDKLTPDQITALKEAAEKATPGPWKAFNMTDVDGAPMSAQEIGQYVTNSILKSVEDGGFEDQFLFISEPDCGGPDICLVGNGPNGPNNANFLERANPSTILALIAEREALREALKAIDAMPYYTPPIPENYVEGLLARYTKALDTAHKALGE